MLNIKKNISINATPEKVWHFLLSLKYSMLMNRSHTKINFPSDFHSESNRKFQIHQNLAIVKYTFNSKIVTKKPFEKLIISKSISDNSAFTHTILYEIHPTNNSIELRYDLGGDFGSKILEMSLKPILHGIIIDELRNIKSAIESSDERISHQSRAEKLKPI